MKILNAIKKLEKNGFSVESNGNQYWVETEKHNLSFLKNGGNSEEITCIQFRRINDHSDSMTDYHAGYFCNTLTEGIKALKSA